MEKLRALGRGTQLMFIASVLLLISMFFAWQDYGDAGIITRNAWHGLGVVMGLLTIVLIARVAARFADVEVPIPVSFASTSIVLGVLIAACAILTNLVDDYSTFWSYVGVVLAILVAVGAWMELQQAGGIEHLKSQMPSSTAAAAPAAAAPAAPAAAAPAAPAAAAPTAPAAAAEAPPTAQGAAESAATEISETAPEAPDAASDATSDEPSTERES